MMVLSSGAGFDEVVDFWFASGAEAWFSADPEFDALCCDRFGARHRDAVMRRLELWREEPRGVLGLVLLLDQISRNIFRGTARCWAADEQACETAEEAIERGFDMQLTEIERRWLYMPFMHSEDLERQRRSVEFITTRLSDPEVAQYACHHHDIVLRFGRFPHRNAILGRSETDAERCFLIEGGFDGAG